jgi:hypothetical protein
MLTSSRRRGFAVTLWDFARTRRKLWMLPILLVLLLIGGIVVLAQGSALAPFIYTIF